MHEDLSDIPEMRPGTDPEFEQLKEWYREPDLRDNAEREFIGIADWQADFPVIPEPTETTERAVERLLSYFV